MKLEDLIYPMTFATINSDAFEEFNVKRGDLVFVAGTKSVPLSEDDLYTQRVKMLVHLTENEHICTPDIYMMDPASLTKLSDDENKRLIDLANEHANATIN